MININWTIFVQMANFLILMGALHLVLFRPLRKTMQHRRDEVEGHQQQAETLDRRLDKGLRDYQEKVQKTRIDIEKDRTRLREELTGETAHLLKQTQDIASEELQRARERILEEKTRAVENLNNWTGSLAAQIVHKIVGREI